LFLPQPQRRNNWGQSFYTKNQIGIIVLKSKGIHSWQTNRKHQKARKPILLMTSIRKVRDILKSSSDSIGPHRILEKLRTGGRGEVYRAEQRTPIRREVAMKLIKLGMDTKQIIARFSAERQALAMMDHPNIAKVFDAGTDETGRPYFVMEYVKGKPITA